MPWHFLPSLLRTLNSGGGGVEALGIWGVSVFIVLSGFLMSYRHLKSGESLQPGLRFAWSKMRRLYPLHIVTMLACLLIGLWNVVTEGGSLLLLGANVVVNVFMVQAYVPVREVFQSLNGVSWFMAVTVLTYAVFTLLRAPLRKIKSGNSCVKVLLILFALEALIALLGFLLGGESIDDVPSTRWIVYYFPLSRLPDFAIGCVLGRMFAICEADGSCELADSDTSIGLTLALVVLSWLAFAFQATLLGSDAIRFALLFAPTSAGLIWFVACAESHEEVSMRFLRSKLLVKVGDLSSYAYLIHWPVIRYLYFVFGRLAPSLVLIAAATSRPYVSFCRPLAKPIHLFSISR